jgi:hypothetical protein
MKFGISTFVTDEGIVPGVLATAVEDRDKKKSRRADSNR